MVIVNPLKPTKEALEKDLRAGMSMAEIATKCEAGVSTVAYWIKNYGLQGIKGKEKVDTEPVATIADKHPESTNEFKAAFNKCTKAMEEDLGVKTIPLVIPTPSPELMIDPNLIPNYPWVDMSKVENLRTASEDTDPELDPKLHSEPSGLLASHGIVSEPIPTPETLETFDEVWLDIREDLVTLRRLYVKRAEKSFKERLHGLFIEVWG